MSYRSYFKKSLKILSIIDDEEVFDPENASLYDPEEIEMIIDVLSKLNFINIEEKGITISEKGRNILNYFKDELESENIIVHKPLVT